MQKWNIIPDRHLSWKLKSVWQILLEILNNVNSGGQFITTWKRKRKKKPSPERRSEFKMQMKFQGISWVAWNEPCLQVQLKPIPSLITSLFNDLVFVYKALSVLPAGDPTRARKPTKPTSGDSLKNTVLRAGSLCDGREACKEIIKGRKKRTWPFQPLNSIYAR